MIAQFLRNRGIAVNIYRLPLIHINRGSRCRSCSGGVSPSQSKAPALTERHYRGTRSSFTSVRSSPSCIEKLESSDELVGSARCADHDGVRG